MSQSCDYCRVIVQSAERSRWHDNGAKVLGFCSEYSGQLIYRRLVRTESIGK